ncbi:hypothetical protein [Hymenobacter yonginensis]|uniref:DUF4136 domain-containing protein n=1 Tax=Hymenobacter yonginensis TaxID=748197 RepID=A0ABY7PKE0_9BACT|nr:hypothetical protein [Hymenobacter yonginensis]WBO83691.1 hypothetical protein O9Z63_15075 [Hymenobacter yonginensis]
MPRFYKPLLLAATLLLAAGCARHTFRDTMVEAPALTTHRTVAIMPFEVALDRLRLRDIRYAGPTPDLSEAGLRRVQQEWTAAQQRDARQLGYQLQRLVLAQLVAQQPARGYTVAFQDVQETNRRLLAAGISYENLPEHSMEELRQVLGVDALLSGQTLLYQPLPNGLNLAARVLLPSELPIAIPSNSATTNLMLHDCHSGHLLWRFDYARAGSSSLKPERLSKDLVHAVAPSLPYRR